MTRLSGQLSITCRVKHLVASYMKCLVINLFCETAVESMVVMAEYTVTIFTACVACIAEAGALVMLFAFLIYLLVYSQQEY